MTDLTAREYLRVSVDKSGRERSNDEQAAENRATFPELAFNGSAYSDVGSASRYARKARGDFDDLVRDLAAGRFGADVLVLWEGSRGSRRVGEWVNLIELLEDRGKRVAITLAERIYDPANANDRRELISMANDAEYESAKTSKRSRRAAAASAAAGRPNGRIPYGYRRVYEATPQGHRLVGQELDPDEAAVMRELYDRLKRGHSMKSVARDFEARGIRSRTGHRLSQQTLRSMVLRRLYIGERVHNGKVYKAEWPALVDEVTWHAVHRMLTGRKASSPRSGRASHLLSGIVPCDVCGGPLAAESRNGRPGYRCRDRRCVVVDEAALDNLAEKAIVGYLSRPGHAEALTADDGADAELDAARAEVARLRTDLDELYAAVEAGEVSPMIASRSEAGLLERLGKAEERATELSTPSRLRGLIEPGEDVARRWKAAPLSAKREIARIVLTPELLGELRVGRATTRGEVQDRVVWRRDAGDGRSR